MGSPCAMHVKICVFSISSVRSKIQSGIRFSKQEKDEWAWSREEVEFDIQNLLSGGGMAQVGYGRCLSKLYMLYLQLYVFSTFCVFDRHVAISTSIELTAFPGIILFPKSLKLKKFRVIWWQYYNLSCPVCQV